MIEELECYEDNKIVWINMDDMYRPVTDVYISNEIADDNILCIR